MAAEDPRHRALVGGLELVVELLVDAQPDLLRDRLHVEARRHPREQPHDHPEVLEVGAHRARDARVLHLDGDRRARRAASRGRPGRSRRPRSARCRTRAKISSSGSSYSPSITLRISLKETFGAESRSSRELALELLAVLLGDEADVEERHHLAELHRRALHRPEHGDDLLGGLDLAAGERRVGSPRRRARGSPRACRTAGPPVRRRAARSSPSAPPARSGCSRGPSRSCRRSVASGRRVLGVH